MKRTTFIIAILSLFVFNGCFVDNYFVKATKNPKDDAKSSTKSNKPFYDQKTVPLTLYEQRISFDVNAEVFRPSLAMNPKAVVIIAPGSGNISRLGEVNNDGIDNYPESLNQVEMFARALAQNGIFVFSYDKRTCQEKHNPICKNAPSEITNLNSIETLSHDLDFVYEMVAQKLALQKEPSRILIMGFGQAAQSIALSKSLQKASGVILLSPILGQLDKSWIQGLKKSALNAHSEYKKSELLSLAESTEGFFNSLKKGDFPQTSNIRGASVAFWQSWLETTALTLPLIKKSLKPTLMLFSKNDVFFDENNIASSQSSTIKTKVFSNADRNFISKAGPNPEILHQVIEFVSKTPAAK